MKKLVIYILLFVSCAQNTSEQYGNSTRSDLSEDRTGISIDSLEVTNVASVDSNKVDLIAMTEKPHWVYQQVLELYNVIQELTPALEGRTLADFDKTKELGYEILRHREQIKNPQAYADYKGYDKELLEMMMKYTLSPEEINNLRYYGLTNPDTLPGQLLMSWLIMYQPIDFFGTWHPDIPCAGNDFWDQFFSRYYGSVEFVSKMDFSGVPWLIEVDEIKYQDQDYDGPSHWIFWEDYDVAVKKALVTRHALWLAQLIHDYEMKVPLPPKLYEALANFLAYHHFNIGFSQDFDDYQRPLKMEQSSTLSGAPSFHEMNLSSNLIDRYNLSNINTIPGQLLAIEFVEYSRWMEWEAPFLALTSSLGSKQFVEQRLNNIKTYLKEVTNLYDIMEETGYLWRGGVGNPEDILYLATLERKHPLYQQVMRLARVMPLIEANSNALNLEEITGGNPYYAAVRHRETIGYPSDYEDYLGYDVCVVEAMLEATFSPQEIATLQKQNLTTPDTIPGLLLVGWLLKEQTAERFQSWYPDLSLALAPDDFWREVLVRMYGSRTFVEENMWFDQLYGSSWLDFIFMLENSSGPPSEDENYTAYIIRYWYFIEFQTDLYKIAEERRLVLLRELLAKDAIDNKRIKEALAKILAYHSEHIGFAADYEDFIATTENQASSAQLVDQLRMFRHITISDGHYLDSLSRGYDIVKALGSEQFMIHLMTIVDSEKTIGTSKFEKYANAFDRILEPYYALLEELYTAVLEEG